MKKPRPLSRIALLAEDRHLSAAGQECYDEVQAQRKQLAERRLHNHVCNALGQAIANHADEITLSYAECEISGTVYRGASGLYFWQDSGSRIYPHTVVKIVTKGGEVLWLK